MKTQFFLFLISLLLSVPAFAAEPAKPAAPVAAPAAAAAPAAKPAAAVPYVKGSVTADDKPVLPPKIAQDKLPKKVKLEGAAYIPFPTFDRGQKITGGGFLLLPPNLIVGKDQVPVVVILHGSRGVSPDHEYVYARELVKMGVAAFVVDSFTPRGIATTHENQRLISIRDFTVDAYRALFAIRNEPRIDINRAGLLGYSKGGVASLYAAMNIKRRDMRIDDELKYKAHYLFYPGCVTHFYDNSTTGAPITFFLGDKDTYTGYKECIDLSNEMNAKGAKTKTIVYENAMHAWDFPGEDKRPEAEIFLNCNFVQAADGKWTEKKSGVTGMRGLEGALYEKALKGCLTYGEVSRENPEANAKSMADFKRLVKEQLVDSK